MRAIIIGNPNVGKSSVLNKLTGGKALVSNYSGTSVEITNVKANIINRDITIYDTPGIYSLYSVGNEAEKIREIIYDKKIDLILNIVDATNLERNLLLTIELLELGIPVVMVLNQIDRARTLGIRIDTGQLAGLLNCKVVTFSAATGEGLVRLINLLENFEENYSSNKVYSPATGATCSGCCLQCEANYQGMEELKRLEKTRQIALLVTRKTSKNQKLWLEKMENLIDHPFIGILLLFSFVYLSFAVLLQFIQFSEGLLNTALEPLTIIIENSINNLLAPSVISTILAKAIPEGIIIPFTIIMPAMLMVSILMSIVEDTGILPRYSVALERIGKFFGVSGQAIIPISLGFGCRTPAIVATRIMPSMAERFIVITILSIVIPCAATLGILASVISTFKVPLMIVLFTMLGVLMILGFILSKLMPREEIFIYELPPLRIPLWTNIWNKIKIRFSGFFKEVLPLLLILNIGIRALMESDLLTIFSNMQDFTRALFGIPAEAFVAVLITIFQRYLAPLVLLNLPLNTREATIAITMVALSLPCLPAMVMTIREIGIKKLGKILALGFTTSISVGLVLNLVLP